MPMGARPSATACLPHALLLTLPLLPLCPAHATLPALVTALPCCCCSAYPQHPSTQRHGQPSCSGPLPLARLSSVLSAPDPNTDTPGDSYQPPLLICTVSTRHQKLRLYLFVPRKSPAWNTRPGIDAPQKFYKQKSGLGPGLADPWPRSKVTAWPYFLGCPIPWPWRRCDGPESS